MASFDTHLFTVVMHFHGLKEIGKNERKILFGKYDLNLFCSVKEPFCKQLSIVRKYFNENFTRHRYFCIIILLYFSYHSCIVLNKFFKYRNEQKFVQGWREVGGYVFVLS